jgi:hypothetical protein
MLSSEIPRISLAEFYKDYLADEGYRPAIDGDGDVTFKHEGRNYYISVDEDDTQFFRLIYPAFWKIESEEELELAIQTCIETTKMIKAAKFYLADNNSYVSASIEAFFSSPDEVKKIFPRYIGCLQNAVTSFAEEMRNKQGGSEKRGE